MYATGHAQYRTQAATTASPAQLVLMLYNGALDELARAELALEQPVDREAAHEALTRAQAIVGELSITLDHERGGEVARNLASLYGFCLEQLIEANVTKSADGLSAAADVLRGLRDAWEQACCQTAAGVGT